MLLDIDKAANAETTTLRAVVVGAVGSTQVLLEELTRSPDWEVPLVVTLPPQLHSRHSDIVDLEPLALSAGAELLTIARSNDPATLSVVRAARPDYVFVVGWSQLVGPDFLAIASRGSIGYHPAPLPRLRGRAAIPWTILLNEPISASSLFWIAEGTDDGDILAQKYFHVAADETAQTLYDKHMNALRIMLREALPRLAAGEQPRVVQDERYATWSTRRTPADGRIDWHSDAISIDRLIRAVGRPYPGAFTQAGARRLTAWNARVVAGEARYHAIPGQILAKADGKLLVQTGNGLIELTDWDVEPGPALTLHTILGNG